MKRISDIKQFVRNTLGCACAENVFEQITCDYEVWIENDLSLMAKINIGNKLLIFVANIENTDSLAATITNLIRHGKQERNINGFNRFRLVIVSDITEEVSTSLNLLLRDCLDIDDKIHIHLVDYAEFSKLLVEIG